MAVIPSPFSRKPTQTDTPDPFGQLSSNPLFGGVKPSATPQQSTVAPKPAATTTPARSTAVVPPAGATAGAFTPPPVAKPAGTRTAYETYEPPTNIGDVYSAAGSAISRDPLSAEQVLNIAGKQQVAETAGEPKAEELKFMPRPRPEVTTGTTTKVATGCGNLYITINSDELGRPFEVFTQMGKAGGCAASQLEAIGRLVSLALRSNIEFKSIIEQLRNIRCPSPSWEKGVRIFSCADALARVIERRLINNRIPEVASVSQSHQSLQQDPQPQQGFQNSIQESQQHGVSNIVGVCPDCGGALRHEEGCVKCCACGFTRC